MKYQVGDTVLILHSNEEATVVDIINDKMLLVDVKGIHFPVYMDQVDFPYFKRFTEKKTLPKREKQYVDDVRKEKKVQDDRKEDGVWLSFLPVMDTDEYGDTVVEELKLHLLNHTRESYQFTYKLHFFGKPDFELKNNIHQFGDFYLHDIPFSHLNDSPSFEFIFQLSEHRKEKENVHSVIIKLKPKQIFAKIEELKQKDLATFTQLLFEKYPDKKVEDIIEPGILVSKGYKIYNASNARQHIEPARQIVDLHIEKLTDDWKHLSNFEILSLQLKTFEKYYHLALVHHLPSMIVIHGVGEGILRNEVHDILRLKKEVRTFVNQYDPRFGYGATEIYFQY